MNEDRSHDGWWWTSLLLHGTLLLLLGLIEADAATPEPPELRMQWGASTPAVAEETVVVIEPALAPAGSLAPPSTTPGIVDGDKVVPIVPIHVIACPGPFIVDHSHDQGLLDSYEPVTPNDRAVVRALEWLVEHQLSDGGWCFDHRCEKCQGECGNHGSAKASRNAATGLVLLAFLGAGQTPLQGRFGRTVQDALDFLLRQSRGKAMVDFADDDGPFDGHALATLALTEAYAMTRDVGLRRSAQKALDRFTVQQDA